MKKNRISQKAKPRSFEEKFSTEAEFFGTREGERPPRSPYVKKIAWSILGMLGGIALLSGVLGLSTLWQVAGITAEDGQLYAASVVEERAGVQKGEQMLSFDSAAVVKRLKAELPLLDNIKVRKHLNGQISISFDEITEAYYTCHNANYYLLAADDAEVLGVFSNPNEAKRVGAVYIGLPENARVRVGEKLTFINLPYEPDSIPEDQVDYELETDEPEVEYAYVMEFVETLMASPLAPRVTGMELSDRYDLWLVLDRRIKVRIGDMEELDRKLSLTEKSLADRFEGGKNDVGMPILVDVSDPTRIIHRVSPDIELPDWTEGPM